MGVAFTNSVLGWAAAGEAMCGGERAFLAPAKPRRTLPSPLGRVESAGESWPGCRDMCTVVVVYRGVEDLTVRMVSWFRSCAGTAFGGCVRGVGPGPKGVAGRVPQARIVLTSTSLPRRASSLLVAGSRPDIGAARALGQGRRCIKMRRRRGIPVGAALKSEANRSIESQSWRHRAGRAGTEKQRSESWQRRRVERRGRGSRRRCAGVFAKGRRRETTPRPH